MDGGYVFSIDKALESVWGLAGSAYTWVTTHELTAIIFACSLIPVGFMIFRKAKKSAY